MTPSAQLLRRRLVLIRSALQYLRTGGLAGQLHPFASLVTPRAEELDALVDEVTDALFLLDHLDGELQSAQAHELLEWEPSSAEIH